MIQVKFYEDIEDELLDFAVIVSKYQGKWVYCKHKERNTFEVPGGRREKDENIMDTAKRELYEETGAVEFELNKVCVYSVINEGKESFGMLFFAEINKFGEMPDMEIEKIEFFDGLPSELTYPSIQPKLLKKIQEIQK